MQPSRRFTNDLTRVIQSATSLKLLPGRKATPFIIVGGPRSGSTLLQTLLDSHPYAICMHEIVKEGSGRSGFERYFLGSRDKLLQIRGKDDEGKEFLKEIFNSRVPCWVEALGFKALYTFPWSSEKRKKTWLALGEIPDLRVIWLSRNPVRRVLSFAIARKTGQWRGQRTVEPVEVDPIYVVRRLRRDDELAQAARRRLRDTAMLHVQFEDLIALPEAELRNIQKKLNLPVRSLHTSLRRQNPKPMDQAVANYSKVRKEISKTKWKKELLRMEAEPVLEEI